MATSDEEKTESVVWVYITVLDLGHIETILDVFTVYNCATLI